MDVTSKVLLRELSGECTAEEAVATYRAFVSRVKGFLSAEEPSLSMIDGTALSTSLHGIGGLLAIRNEYQHALEAYGLSFSMLSYIDTEQMSHEDKATFLYESIDGCAQDPLEEGNDELVDAIYEVALNCPLAQDPSVREGISQLRYQGLASLPKPSWEDDDDEDDDAPVTIYLPHAGGSQPPARDISLPKLYNGRAMVWRVSPRAARS